MAQYEGDEHPESEGIYILDTDYDTYLLKYSCEELTDEEDPEQTSRLE